MVESSKLPEDIILKYMLEAMNVAKQAITDREVPVGCVFVQIIANEYKIIQFAHNQTVKSKNATQHCEIICINELKNQQFENFQNLYLFVTCEPCIMCAYALSIVGIKEVYYGCYNNKFGGNGSVLNLHNGNYGQNFQYKSYGGYLETECMDILKRFYELGNQNLEESKRHRKKIKV